MGGKLFNLGRLPRTQYLSLEIKMRTYLDAKIPDAYRIPRYYASKADFGDMDIIVCPTRAGKEWATLRQEICGELGITTYKVEGNVFSTVYQNLQVDFFTTPEEYFESTHNYLSFNDLGNLIGRICKRFNLKYGEQGLLYVYRREAGNYSKDIGITTDFRRICTFLGLNYAIWEAGFDSLEQLFEWVIASPYFSVAPYLNPSKIVEKRAKHRTTIERFLTYLITHGIQKQYLFEEKEAYLNEISAFFPEAHLLTHIANEQASALHTTQLQAKFSGKHIVSLLPNLQGRDLGLFIITFKQQFVNNEAFEAYILAEPMFVIDKKIHLLYQQINTAQNETK